MTPHPLLSAVSSADELLGIRHVLRFDEVLSAELERLPTCLDGDDLAAGVMMMLADIVLARACLRALPGDVRIATTNLHVDIIVPPSGASGRIRSGMTRIDGIVDGGVRCRAELVDSRDTLMATTSGRFAVIGAASDNGRRVRSPFTDDGPATFDESAPLDDVPIRELLGMRVISVQGRQVRLAVPAAPHWSHDLGGIHGGIAALIGEQAASATLKLVEPHSNGLRPYDVRALFFRPIAAQGGFVECTVDVVNCGRTFAATRAEVRTPDGRLGVVVEVLYARSGTTPFEEN